MGLIVSCLPVLLTGVCSWARAEGATIPQAKTLSAHSRLQEKSSLPAGAISTKLPNLTPLIYVVRKGDSLSKIAQAHGISRARLLELNKLRTNKNIFPGQKLVLPSGKVPSPSPGKAAAGQSQALSRQETMIRSALSYQGVHYRYGGLSSRGLDCSGFVVRVMMNQGVSMPHNAAALFAKGVPVSRAGLTRGDLVFFHTRGKSLRISHVGIYLGEGNFIHASSGKGQVRIDTLLKGYYQQHFSGARRILSD
jgi:peptidoglycan DL-endopeptidase LytE